MTQQISVPPSRLRYSVAETAQLLAISQRQVWRLIADGRLQSIREGKRVFLPRSELERAATGA
jgi:excisionase family DNA binding protein